MSEFEIIRGAIDSKEKYCRIPVRSKIAETMMEDGKYVVYSYNVIFGKFCCFFCNLRRKANEICWFKRPV